jgi:Tfp pilus assembly protein PilP
MSAGGQRQEVRFLAMTIGALVVALALFVGVRSLSPKPTSASTKRKPRTKDTKPPTKKTEQAKPLPSSNRDPFAAAGAKDVSVTDWNVARRDPRRAAVDSRRRPVGNADGSELDVSDIRLAGIMRGAGAMALIHVGDQRYYAQLGDQVGGFTLVRIGTNSVVLAEGARKMTLTIQPEPGSGGARTRARPNRRR